MRRSFIVSCGLAIAVTSSCTSIRTTEPPPPRLLTPQANAYVGSALVLASLRTTFTWAAPDIGVYDRYELQLSRDPGFITDVIEHSTSNTRLPLVSPLPVSAVPPVGARYYWRVRACTSDECFPYSPPRRLNVGRNNRDFNGDGFADVAIGAPQVTNSPAQPGRVVVYHGRSSFDTTPEAQLLGSANSSFFGVSVSAAGDVNGDGYADLIVGANGVDAQGTVDGHAHLYFGSSIGLINPSSVDLRGGGGAFGRTVAGAGDVNGDGFDDVLVGSPELLAGGQVWLYYGGAGPFDLTPDLKYVSKASGDGFGYAISAGDVNGDGYSDVLVGARNHNSGVATMSNLAGRAYLYLGNASSLISATSTSMIQGAAGSALGAAVSLTGDLDQDGYADPVIGAPSGATGQVSLFRGGPDASLTAPVSALSGGPSYGEALATDSDLDGDGRPELLVGAPLEGVEAFSAGRAYAYFKVPGAGPPASVTLPGPDANARLGFAIAGAGDVNGDGFGEVVVGANGLGGGIEGIGGAYVYYGAGTGLEPTADWSTTGSFVGDRYGNAVAAAAPAPRSTSRSCRAAPNGASNRPAARCARRSPR